MKMRMRFREIGCARGELLVVVALIGILVAAFPPQPDGPHENDMIFGGAHPAIWNAAFCDGHVEAMGFDIDPIVHRSYGNRQDGFTD